MFLNVYFKFELYEYFFKLWFIRVKVKFSAPLLQSVSHDPSEIILIC